jgi:hypothetical protein
VRISVYKLFFLLAQLFFVSACAPGRHIPEEQYLLNKSKIIIEDAEVGRSELRSFLRQRPNRRIFGLYRFHLNVYLLADRGRDTGFKRWIKSAIGEPPVIFDQVLTENTRRQFELYMLNKGYFNASVKQDVHFRGNRAIVTYHIEGNIPYVIRDISYNIADHHLKEFVLSDAGNTLVREGDKYDADILQKERNRIARHLKSEGFFNFSREFVFFSVDSTLNSHQLDIDIVINDPSVVRPTRSDDTYSARHRRYVIDSIYVYPELTSFRQELSFPDTTVYKAERNSQAPSYIFVHNGPMRVRPRAIANNILMEQGGYFNIEEAEQTYAFLARLRNYRFINIQFTENHSPMLGAPSDTLGFLNTSVQLVRAPANAFTVEAEGLNSSGNLGVAGNIIYHNRNIFRGAETFNIRLKGALEVSGESSTDEVIQRLPFNTLELGADFSIDFPKLLIPFRPERLSKTSRPKSILMTGINYRQRPDYTRYILNASYGFEWSQNSRKKHFLHPIEVSSIKLYNDSLLQAKIPENNPLLRSRFSDHLIAGTKYSFVYSTQQLERESNFVFFRGNLELAGNMLYLGSRLMDESVTRDESYSIFNIPFAQYFRADGDFRYYQSFNPNNTLVFRLMAGAGLPYGNGNVMPFIKSFYGGGANSLRAWSIYSLGPGSYQDTISVGFDRYGDIKLEANVEYRFNIYRFFRGALFADAGNVWFMKDNPQFPGGAFAVNTFYRDLALGTGAGLRLDFDFFIVRLDAAFPVRDPAMPPGQRWASSLPRLSKWNFNLGIGYPF